MARKPARTSKPPKPAHPHGTPCWVDLATPDPEASRLFYGALFGWKFQVGPPDTGNYTICQLQGRAVAGMQGQPAPEGEPHAWTVHFAVEDAAAVGRAVTEAGGMVLAGPVNVMEEGRMLLAADPTGAAFGVWEAGITVGAEALGVPGAMAWTELATTDLDAAAAFYQAVLPQRWEPLDTGRGGPRYATFRVDSRPAGGTPADGAPVGGGPVGGAMEVLTDRPETRPQWRTYFAVADTDAAAESVTRLGGQVVSGPAASPHGRLAEARDPHGALFLVIAPTAS